MSLENTTENTAENVANLNNDIHVGVSTSAELLKTAEPNSVVVLHQEGEMYGRGLIVESSDGNSTILCDVNGSKFKLETTETGETTLTKLEQVDPKLRYNVRRMCMIAQNFCMFCKETGVEPCTEIHLGRMWGWVICSTCITNGRAKSEIIGYMTHHKVVPLSWMSNSNTFKQTPENARTIKFFRYSQRDTQKPVQKGKLDWIDGSRIIYYNHNRQTYGVDLSFADVNGSASRVVSLQNLFSHNPTLYNELTQCDDLLDDQDIKIGWCDVSPEVRNEITTLNNNAKTADPFSFVF